MPMRDIATCIGLHRYAGSDTTDRYPSRRQDQPGSAAIALSWHAQERNLMARLNLKAIEQRVAPLAGRERYDREFLFDLLLAYGKPQSSITRLRSGDLTSGFHGGVV